METFPSYVYICLNYLVVPICVVVFCCFLLGYVQFFYEYSLTMLLVGTTFMAIGFFPFGYYLHRYKDDITKSRFLLRLVSVNYDSAVMSQPLFEMEERDDRLPFPSLKTAEESWR